MCNVIQMISLGVALLSGAPEEDAKTRKQKRAKNVSLCLCSRFRCKNFRIVRCSDYIWHKLMSGTLENLYLGDVG